MISEKQIDWTWNKVKEFWTHVNLDKPRVYIKEEREGLGEEIAAFDQANKKVYVDEANLEKRLGKDKFGTVLNHEVGHHKLCPVNLREYFRLTANAYKVTKNIKLAKLVENLFADLVVNTHLYKEGNKQIVDVYKEFSKQNDSKMWQFYIATFENMLEKPGIINNKEMKEEMRKDAAKLGEMMSKSVYKQSEWPKSIRELAKYVKKYMEQDAKPKGGGDSAQQNKEKNQNKKKNEKKQKETMIDEQGVNDFLPFKKYSKNKEVRKQQAKVVEKELKGLSKELGGEDFKKVLKGLGLGTDSQAKIWLYRDLASSYMLELPKNMAGVKSSIPLVPEKWRVSDPAEKLNVEYSLSNFGVLIPNVTTYQFNSKKHSYQVGGDEAPDLLIAIDSSGSMPDPDHYMSFPVLSAMLSARTALEYGKKVGVVNFSDSYSKVDFTNDSEKIDEALTSYFGRGTTIPGKVIRDMINKNKYPAHLLIISDTEIYNLNSEMTNLDYALKKGKAGGTIFLDCKPSSNTKMLSNIGFDVQFTRNFADLADLSLKKTKGLYEKK